MKTRQVAREILDDLAEDDPDAIRSRRDLGRVHRAMGTRTMLLRALREMTASRRDRAPLRVLELGAGDGSLMLGVAQELAPSWPKVELTLLDAQAVVGRDTLARFAQLGWTAVAEVNDVFDWAAGTNDPRLMNRQPARWDLIVSNLFLHHFEDEHLAGLFGAIADRGARFFASEPRRARLALAGSHLVGLLGSNWVTRQDAVSSVRAGFRGQELSALWPDVGRRWHVREYAAGLFSHCFRAEPMDTSHANTV
ncbi:methyltransferase domain-containing protein [Rhodoferax sp.]|uniref:methyltransferase domain-containing protein n=1 Tax=Rhodoferax sp. TaxID=50421 RepID=UPI002778223D|nr:methyltransferase domain-containing protein [Rhodoferax sp.]